MCVPSCEAFTDQYSTRGNLITETTKTGQDVPVSPQQATMSLNNNEKEEEAESLAASPDPVALQRQFSTAHWKETGTEAGGRTSGLTAYKSGQKNHLQRYMPLHTIAANGASWNTACPDVAPNSPMGVKGARQQKRKRRLLVFGKGILLW
ncbi:hypothetical protein PoB_007479300 [Plakobranchus ocellatus]|uniref:Uncharacterized protein n=1 Tax=Plakobranchus ocellatus TaxID=259542 RepID=A0AAV4DVK6_9GAST|nr:hypothetical protein PoB_007479300 [Plakobranchus ocellatus]